MGDKSLDPGLVTKPSSGQAEAFDVLGGNRGHTNGNFNTNRFLPSLPGSLQSSRAPHDAALQADHQSADPISNAIFRRANKSAGMSVNAPRGVENGGLMNETDPEERPRSKSIDPQVSRSDSVVSASKDKRNRGSFFSRLVAPKRKESIDVHHEERKSKEDHRRHEAAEQVLFSQPIGYVPQFPVPPKYVKVRAHGKKDKDFGKLFLAQELGGRSGAEIAQNGGRSVGSLVPKPAASRKDDNAIWAMEFSRDGKYLAAGGKDYAVRIWAVMTTKYDRQAFEKEEESGSVDGQSVHLNAPVFAKKTVQEYYGHTASVLDLSWSKNNFLLSSSMDKTVRLWHMSRTECLCCFKHSDFVTSIQFHPRDDRFFLAGSLDSKLRLWSIPDKSVAYWVALPEFITAVAFSTDGKTAIAGCLNGLCHFYDTEGLKFQTQLHVRSAHGKNAKGSKVTGIQAINMPPDDANGEVKILITTNDSRVRVYNLRDKGLEYKFKGNENACSQIHATFSDDAKYIICGSEDRKAYIWPLVSADIEKDKRPMEVFEAHQAMVTVALMAPTKTRQVLSASRDPLYDLCNPPPVTLVSRTESHASSIPPTEDDHHTSSVPPTPSVAETPKRPEESPAYLARCTHTNGNIIVTADFLGNIKVFRQDCAYENRARNNDSTLTKKMLGRANSVATRNSTRSSRTSLQSGVHSSERIMSWQQSINSNNESCDSFRGLHHAPSHGRSISPRKSIGPASLRHPSQTDTSIVNGSRPTSGPVTVAPPLDSHESEIPPVPTLTTPTDMEGAGNSLKDLSYDPAMLNGGGDQPYMFWSRSANQVQAAMTRPPLPQYHHNHHLDGLTSSESLVGSSTNVSVAGQDRNHLGLPQLGREVTAVSKLSSEENSEAEISAGEHDDKEDAESEVKCQACGGTGFRVRVNGGRRTLVCTACGRAS